MLRNKTNDNVCSNRFSTLGSIWKDRPDLEHQQATLRIFVGTIIFSYLLYTVFLEPDFTSGDYFTLITSGIFFFVAFAIVVWLVINPETCVVRRLIGILLDNSATTAAIYFQGTLGAPLFVLYLWISFGNGFRYGQKYLVFSTVLGLLGFSFVSFLTDRLQMNGFVTLGLFLGLIMLPLYVASLLRQINKSLELAQNANQAKSIFLATMSHEIRTPLNGLVGVTEMLGKTELHSKQHHYVKLISKSSEWLMRVINDGLDFSKIEANEFLVLKDKFDLRNNLKDLCNLYEGLQAGKKVSFSHHLAADLPRMVIGDHMRLTQVLGNLLSNGFKFTEKGQVSFHAEVLSRQDDGIEILFKISDTGKGIPLEKQQLIFEPFQQADAGITKEYGGTGLGLAIAARIVKLLGGEITLDSEPGKGSSFSFQMFFPLVAEDAIQVDRFEIVNDLRAWLRPPQILLVEDHEINIEVLVSQLKHMGCEVIVAENGLEAIGFMSNGELDLVLMDCQMPVMDGYEATRHRRLLEKDYPEKYPRLPIIALTAHVTIEDKEKCLASGMDDYLGKPFTAGSLQVLINKWLSHLLANGYKKRELRDEQKQKAEQQSVPTDKRKLLHDLRNMIFAIHGSAELSSMNINQKERQQEHLERICTAAQKAGKIIEELAEKTSTTKA